MRINNVLNKKYYAVILIISILFLHKPVIGQETINKYFLGIELNGTLCGYSEVTVNNTPADGTNHRLIDQKTYMSFKALGRDIIQKQIFTYHLNPDNGNFVYHDSYMEEGDIKLSCAMTVEGDTIRINSARSNESEKVFLPQNTILPNTMYFPHLKKDFGDQDLDSKKYRIFNLRTGKINDVGYKKVARENLELNNIIYDALIVDESDPSSGLLTRYWIDSESGMRLQMESQNRIRMYLADMMIVNKIKTGNWDDMLFIKTNKTIEDLRMISSIKVKANLDAIPAPDIKDINVHGQLFKGDITDNNINGIFEVKHTNYDGKNALGFGNDNTFSQDISVFLSPEERIESDDPELVSLALRITEGSADFWEAACSLSNWVAENIDGSLSGGSALETFKIGHGACGSQSLLLAALCRAAGIPARVVWGCLYTPEYGGSFGHHGWNEVYMGEAGWIPLDATLHETDYVDSGHIRLGIFNTEVTVLNFKEMVILDYSLN